MIFGGETKANVEACDECFVLAKSKINDFVNISPGPKLPVACTPAVSSQALNCSSFHYFVSDYAYVYRLNKNELTWG